MLGKLRKKITLLHITIASKLKGTKIKENAIRARNTHNGKIGIDATISRPSFSIMYQVVSKFVFFTKVNI